jgi:hypothetical protein
MANPNLQDIAVRKKVIDAIKSSENKARKLNEQRKFDIYRKRQAAYVLERLQDEFDPKTVQGMRKVLSINPCKRIVDEQASLYVDEPERHFVNASKAEEQQLEDIYKYGAVNSQMRLANRYYKLHGQAAAYVLPRNKKIAVRALTPKDYDVIPDADDPEHAFAYVLNVMDYELARTAPADSTERQSAPGYAQNDRMNEIIADKNDSKALLERYVFWTAEHHFTTDGTGEVISDPFFDTDGSASELQPNPIGRLPFVDIAHEKDFRFFVEIGSDVAEFVLDFLTQLSDLANTCRFQNYSQAVISSTESPKDVNVGPNRILWLKLDPNAPEAKPSFAFESPAPDIMGTLEFLNVQMKLFLSSCGLNPGAVSGKNEMEKFTSGIDHLLANLDKFKASKEDMDLFRCAEDEVFELLLAWHNVMFDVSDDDELIEDLTTTRITADVDLNIVYVEPQAVQTQGETQDYCIKGVEAGLMTTLEAIKRMYGVDDAKAKEIQKEIQAEVAQKLKDAQAAMVANGAAMGAQPGGKPGAPGAGQNPADPKAALTVNPDDPYGVNDPGAAGMTGNGKQDNQVVKLPKPLTGSKTK